MMAELMFRKQKYEDAINLYQQVLEKAPGNCLHEDCPLRWPASVPRPARAALPKDGPPPLLPDWTEEAPSSLIVSRETGN